MNDRMFHWGQNTTVRDKVRTVHHDIISHTTDFQPRSGKCERL